MTFSLRILFYRAEFLVPLITLKTPHHDAASFSELVFCGIYEGILTFLKLPLLSRQFSEWFPRSLWGSRFNQCWLWPWNAPTEAIFAQFLVVAHWLLDFLEVFSCFGFLCNLLGENLIGSVRTFGSSATCGTVKHRSVFSPFVDNGSYCGSLKSQSLRNGLA